MGDKRNYTDEHVKSLQGSLRIEHTLAKVGAKQLRDLFESEPYVNVKSVKGAVMIEHTK